MLPRTVSVLANQVGKTAMVAQRSLMISAVQRAAVKGELVIKKNLDSAFENVLFF